MRKTNQNYLFLSMMFVSILILCNIISIKPIKLFNIDNTVITVPASAFLFIFTFFISNVIVHTFGNKAAKQLTKFGIICQLLCATIFLIVDTLPSSSQNIQTSYHLILGNNLMFLVGGTIAYEISQKLNIYLFSKLSKTKSKSFSNFISLAVSQIVDDVLFIGIGFGIGLRYLFNVDLFITMLIMIASQYSIKLILSIIITPVFSRITKKSRIVIE